VQRKIGRRGKSDTARADYDLGKARGRLPILIRRAAKGERSLKDSLHRGQP